MTSDRKIRANRANARASSGPKTAAGKAQSAQNAFRHGFSVPIWLDPDLASDVEALAQRIVGKGADANVLQPARRVAEAQIDLRRVRAHRNWLIERAMPDPKVEAEVADGFAPRAAASRIGGGKIWADRSRRTFGRGKTLAALDRSLRPAKSSSGGARQGACGARSLRAPRPVAAQIRRSGGRPRARRGRTARPRRGSGALGRGGERGLRNEAKPKDPMKSISCGKPLARCAITPLDTPLPGVTAAQKFRRWRGSISRCRSECQGRGLRRDSKRANWIGPAITRSNSDNSCTRGATQIDAAMTRAW